MMGTILSFVAAVAALAAQQPPSMPIRAGGTFDVKLETQGEDASEGSTLGRMTIGKLYHGDLEGTAKGEMLTAMTSVKESAAYVAVERVSGTLHGRRGTFVLQHRGTMTRGAQELVITVVPDSGTGDLKGIAGSMTIKIAEGKHFYEFDYSLPVAP